MPSDSKTSISFHPASHASKPFTEKGGFVGSGLNPALALLRAVAKEQSELCAELLHSSPAIGSSAMLDIIPQRNGFVHTVVEAYNQHRALILRPDDVWLAILTQFCFFANGNAEICRDVFVVREGKEELVIKDRYSLYPAYMAAQMTRLMKENIIDESLREWIIPSFTTTTAADTAASAIVMMGTMKGFFSYTFHMLCGIPKVTLEGKKKDWEDILQRLEHLKEYGVQTIAWYHLLRPIISQFVASYDDPSSPSNLTFWSKVAHFSSDGNGPTWLSGWITAFCVFGEEGEWQGNVFSKNMEDAKDSLQLSASQFASAYLLPPPKTYLALDGFPYPRINIDKVPSGYIQVDVKLTDNGRIFDTMFVAGFIGSRISSTGEEASTESKRDTVQPISGWWYFIKADKTEQGSGSPDGGR